MLLSEVFSQLCYALVSLTASIIFCMNLLLNDRVAGFSVRCRLDLLLPFRHVRESAIMENDYYVSLVYAYCVNSLILLRRDASDVL